MVFSVFLQLEAPGPPWSKKPTYYNAAGKNLLAASSSRDSRRHCGSSISLILLSQSDPALQRGNMALSANHCHIFKNNNNSQFARKAMV